jgi:hypothetical protein
MQSISPFSSSEGTTSVVPYIPHHNPALAGLLLFKAHCKQIGTEGKEIE